MAASVHRANILRLRKVLSPYDQPVAGIVEVDRWDTDTEGARWSPRRSAAALRLSDGHAVAGKGGVTHSRRRYAAQASGSALGNAGRS